LQDTPRLDRVAHVNAEAYKQEAAAAALAYLPDSGVLGLGTGSTAACFIRAVAELVRGGRRLSGVPTSQQSRELASELGIPLLDDAGPWAVDVCVDGADEVDPQLNLIKGGGGAHAREKVVNLAAATNIILVDESKLVTALGTTRGVPVEVLNFGHAATARELAHFGAPTLRLSSGLPLVTDSGNRIYDLATGPISDPAALERTLSFIPGVVAVGLFCGRADRVIVAGPGGIRELQAGRR
jgi:ribose 5-phosphate isomerase A